MTEEGAEFQSYVDGKRILLSPELSIATQKAIGSDIMMVLDQCIPSTAERAQAITAMELTHRWAKRSLTARDDSPQSMFAIIQGACFADLRKQSADTLTQMPFDGFAIGGLAVGESRAQREDFTELTAELMPANLPRYLMGVGTPIDLLEAVHRGVDMFDCILPVSLAQQGVAYTSRGRMELRRSVYKFSDETLDPACPCATCAQFSRAYLHHLVKAKEVLGWQLIGEHNLSFYHRLMADMRQAILADRFRDYYRSTKPILESSDDDNPKIFPKPSRSRKPSRELGDYEIRENPSGSFSIRHKSSGEVMHSVNDPIEEARALYIEGSRLQERLSEADQESPLVLWDVGLGAATNAMAAVRCFEELQNPRPLIIYSFENDLNSLKLAAKFAGLFPQLKHSAPHLLLSNGEWVSQNGRLHWKLLHGNFVDLIDKAPTPDLVFYDPFSYKTNSPLWSLEIFKTIFDRCKGRHTELYTYSASTAVRAALLGAGFYVARGRGTGPKEETTIAMTSPRPERISGPNCSGGALLGPEWLQRWHRSGAKYPSGLAPDEEKALELLITQHSQWKMPPT
jgi:queuine tRNA-ribosyltransferase